MTAFCACELRSPAPFTEQGFRAFNEVYVVTLERWGLFDGKVNPVARSNVCPELAPPGEPSFHAFSFTVATAGAAPTFVIAGGAGRGREVQAMASAPSGAVKPARMPCARKHALVLDEMERRLVGVRVSGWDDTTATQVYTVHDLYPFLADEIVRRGAAHAGLTWHYARPPVRELEFEMDCRGVSEESVV